MKQIEFNCPSCNAPLSAPIEEAGDKFPCPTCHSPLTVPETAEFKKLKVENAKVAEERAKRIAARAAKTEEIRREARQGKALTPPEEIYVADPAERIPDYQDIVLGARWLSVVSFFFNVLGGVLLSSPHSCRHFER